MGKTPISVLLPTFNCEGTIQATLDSVKWADELLVVDPFSKDRTVELCCKSGARVIQHEYINSATQKNWAIPQCTNEWILQIDSDEVLEPGLEAEVRAAVNGAGEDLHAFRIPRKNHVLGRWMRHGGIYPDYQTRLFRKSVSRLSYREVHAHLEVKGKVGTLRGNILHYGMPNLSTQLRNLDRYTRYEADELRKRGVQFRWHHVLVRPWLIFFHRYIWLQGYRDGWRGFILCAYLAFYTMMARAKLWEMKEMGLDVSPKA